MPVVPEMNVFIQNEDGSTANFPLTAKKTPIFQPSVVPAGYYFYGTGAFDDIPGGKRGEGAQLALEAVGADTTVTITGRFLEHVYILGGKFEAIGAGYEDWLTLEMRAPASTPEDRTGTHDGNANKVDTTKGFNIIVPAPGNDGDWNVDGTTLEVGEINQGLCPVPNAAGTGYWDWDPTITPSITPNLAGEGGFDLFDLTLPLARQANRYPCIVGGDVTPAAAIKGKKILPHWEWHFSMYRKEAGTLQVAVLLDTARLSTT